MISERFSVPSTLLSVSFGSSWRGLPVGVFSFSYHIHHDRVFRNGDSNSSIFFLRRPKPVRGFSSIFFPNSNFALAIRAFINHRANNRKSTIEKRLAGNTVEEYCPPPRCLHTTNLESGSTTVSCHVVLCIFCIKRKKKPNDIFLSYLYSNFFPRGLAVGRLARRRGGLTDCFNIETKWKKNRKKSTDNIVCKLSLRIGIRPAFLVEKYYAPRAHRMLFGRCRPLNNNRMKKQTSGPRDATCVSHASSRRSIWLNFRTTGARSLRPEAWGETGDAWGGGGGEIDREIFQDSPGVRWLSLFLDFQGKKIGVIFSAYVLAGISRRRMKINVNNNLR